MKKSYRTGALKVSDGHILNYELYGNPKASPILYLHGGPGSGFTDRQKRFFDPKIHNVIFYDQRGSGKSTPFASLHENNTQKLIQDIKDLLDFLGFKKVILMGGSWGSTLGLVFAIQKKKYVAGMILWGIFFGTKQDIDFSWQGVATADFFPEKWQRFISLVPENERKDIVNYYFKKMTDGSRGAEKYTYEWAYYESSLLELRINEKEISKDLKTGSYKALSPIEAYYFINNCFLPDNYILENASKLSGIPTSIVHGRYDFLCPPNNAYQLHNKIKGSRLSFVIGGHSTRDKEIEKKVIVELKKIQSLL